MELLPWPANRLLLEKGIPEKHPSLFILDDPPQLEAHFPGCCILALGVTGSLQGLRARFLGEQGDVRCRGFKNQEVSGGAAPGEHGLPESGQKPLSQWSRSAAFVGVLGKSRGWDSAWSVRQTLYHKPSSEEKC